MRHYRLVIFSFLGAFLTLSVCGQTSKNGNWELVGSDRELNIYTRISEDSPIKEIQIVTSIESTMERVKAILSDVENYKAWVYKCVSSERIKTANNNDFHYYVETSLPYPFSNRDLSVHSVQWLNSETGVYHSHSVAASAEVPEKKGVVRIGEFESSWVVTPKLDGTISIVYTAMANPGGEIPTWLVNMVITKGPLETMQKFTELARRIPVSSED